MSSHSATLTFAPLAEPKMATSNRLRKRLFLGLGVGIALSAAAYGSYDTFVASHYVSTDNAYVGASVAQINAQLAGPIFRVLAEDTQNVHKGDVLAVIDPSDASLAVARADADYRRTLQRVAQYYAQRDMAAAQVDARLSDVSRTEGDYARRRNLAESGAISREALAQAETAADGARANLVAARESLEAQNQLVRNVGVENHPETISARAALDKARLDLSRTVIRAPVDGIVAQRHVQVGQMVQPGQQIMTVTPIAEAYVDANFKENQLAKVHVGQTVELTSDLYGTGVVFHGHVAGMGGGTGSAFAVIPAQNATGNWIKVVQRVPVRIRMEPKELAAHPLRVGLSMSATIDTRD
jgi:membrane fusion protein (multidrug efflux system)